MSDEQVDRVRGHAAEAIRASLGEVNPRAAAYLAAEREIEQNVLTGSQREAFQEIKSRNVMRSLRY